MEQDTHITDVIFRVDTTKDWKGTIFAILPHDVADFRGTVTVFDMRSSHGSGDYYHMVRTSRLATEAEYAEIKKCMEVNYGYNFKVIKKKNHDKYLKSYYEARK
jgi:hypothetical protein